ncbi:MAG: SRPBCC domain-containing protein [Gemmatimonadetes bacterium]|nr:SRPBCC domain-containing protein [Gemmatimonadota bacterium]MBT4613458.1 SRPBCC domain-containing protein [Gemmatimonadota bacterium]MBT5146514.1 SRPBCC domain-containing protein [Gemmatimonadota bacterium]MBT5591435.1 SRPBCC domain-containing protein [Gemmatimonadota bacterium]MBT5962110.1 SRPBCC domain-containing protein [Gemmatimonadota bacterium]
MSGTNYDWSRFEITFFYYAPLEKVYRAWATPAGMESFYIKECRTAGPKDELVSAGEQYLFRYVQPFEHDGSFLRVEENKSLAFTFGSMQVNVSFEAIDAGTKVVLCQSGIEDQVMSHMNCRSCWLYFMTNLKSVLEHGLDLRDHDHPDRASSMEVGYLQNGPSS